MKNGDLSKCVDTAVRKEILHRTVQGMQAQNAGGTEEEAIVLANEAAARRGKPMKTGSPEETDKPVWELFEAASREIPDEEVDRLPTDGSWQHDHYIYGTPKCPG